MSVTHAPPPPVADAPARAAAQQTIWRLAAAAFGHPTPELHQAFASGSFHDAFTTAWRAVTGRDWPRPEDAVIADFATLEAGYICAFLHGQGGKPVAPLLAGDYEPLLAGHSRPVFMLNISAFYRHFGLRAATEDEGRADEPDHLASMLEFMAVLSHLEAQTLARSGDATPLRRAQRDFLRRYLEPLLHALATRLRTGRLDVPLDPTLARLVADLHARAEAEAATLEARVGPYYDSDQAVRSGGGPRTQARTVDQDLWS